MKRCCVYFVNYGECIYKETTLSGVFKCTTCFTIKEASLLLRKSNDNWVEYMFLSQTA